MYTLTTIYKPFTTKAYDAVFGERPLTNFEKTNERLYKNINRTLSIEKAIKDLLQC